MPGRIKIKVKGLDEYLEALDRSSGRKFRNKVIEPILEDFGDEVRARARGHYLSGRALDVQTGDLKKSVSVSRKGLPLKIVIGSDETAGVVWEAGKKPRKWLSPAVDDEIAGVERALKARWEREVFRG
jgi:hypothetical protein